MKQFELPVTKPVFRLKGGTLAATVLELVSIAPDALADQLAQKVTQSPQLLRHSPLIIALDKLGDADGPLALDALLATCRAHDLQPVAVRALRANDIAQARTLGIAVLPPSRARERGDGALQEMAANAGAPGEHAAGDTLAGQDCPPDSRPGATSLPMAGEHLADVSPNPADSPATSPADSARMAHATPPPVARPTRVITQPVRGGQQVYSDGDLVLLAPVSAGAEVIAEGHIHCYAPLRGRALAGVSGDASARLFCRELAAELVSIAGRYRIAEDLKADPLWGRAVQLSLSDDQLRLAAL